MWVRPASDLVAEEDLAALPPAARSLMTFHGVAAGTVQPSSVRVGWTGRFRMRPDAPWMRIQAVQYDTRAPVGRLFLMKGRMKRVLPVVVRDIYAAGRGHLLARIADLFTVAECTGRELDEGELVTWLNDCVFFAPSMLLGGSRFSHVDQERFEIAVTDRGTSVTARVRVNSRGAPVDFETTDRYLYDADDASHPFLRARWSTPFDVRRSTDGTVAPVGGRAIWHLASGDFTYAEFEVVPGSLEYDVDPPQQGSRQTERGPTRCAPFT
jgi:hypothetical protein